MYSSNYERIAKNATFLYARMLIVMLINVFSVRFVLNGLGLTDYGIYDLVAGLVTMFSGLSSVVSSATLRFYSFSIGKDNRNGVCEVYTACLNIFICISFVILILGESIGPWFINTKADIPLDRLAAANWVFQFSIISFVITLLTTPFSSLLFAYERMSSFSIISICDCIVKFLLAFSLRFYTKDHLVIYGIGLLIITVVIFFAYITLAKKEGVIKYKKHVEKSLYTSMLSFSGWTLFSSTASVGISQLVTMITNVFFGPIVNAARAVSFQINGSLSSFTNNIILAIKPSMIKYYAEGDFQRVNLYFNFCNKAVFYSLLLILLPLFFEMETVLYYWLGLHDSQTTMFCRMILIYSLILSLNNPISIIVHAVGNIRDYSTLVEIPTLLCLPIIWMLYAMGFPAYFAYYVMIVAISASHCIRLICLKRLFGLFSYKNYMIGFLLPALCTLFIVCILLFLIYNNMNIGIARFSLIFVSNVLLIVGLSSVIGFSSFERQAIIKLVYRK